MDEPAAEPFIEEHSFDLAVDPVLQHEVADTSFFLQQDLVGVTADEAVSTETGFCVLETCCA